MSKTDSMFSERSFILTVWLVCIYMCTESVSWLETHMWAFRPHHRWLQRLSLAGKTQGESCPPHFSHGAQPAHCSLRRELHARTPPPLVAQALTVFLVEVPQCTGPSATVFLGPLPRPLHWGEEQTLRCFFPIRLGI